MVVLILARETWVTSLRAIAANSGKIIPAGTAGKLKSFLQMFAIILLLLHDFPVGFSENLVFQAQLPGEALLMLSIVFSYWGAIEYTWEVLRSEQKEH
jgi:CDP-diacylglycerol--glycerol-3-phosphate 3-phosphatidyltransferase